MEMRSMTAETPRMRELGSTTTRVRIARARTASKGRDDKADDQTDNNQADDNKVDDYQGPHSWKMKVSERVRSTWVAMTVMLNPEVTQVKHT